MDMFSIIKKQNGENFAKVLRTFGLLELENIDRIVKYAGKNPAPVINYLLHLKYSDIKTAPSGGKNPFQLLEKAGYKAEYADTLEKQNSIRNFFAEGEKLCTFDDEERFKHYHIINAVRFDAENIHRSDFPVPRRDDKYGTSVISIQIAKKGGFISIKNRYNHKVKNPDNTFFNNPDNIIPGLSESLKEFFGVDFHNSSEELPEGYTIANGVIIKFNYEVNNIYFGDTFFVKDGVIYNIDKNSELIMDHFIFDMKSKQICSAYHGINLATQDSFPEVFSEEIKNKKLQIVKNGKNSVLMADNTPIVELKDGTIVKLNLNNTKTIPSDFLTHNNTLTDFTAKNLYLIENDFLNHNSVLSNFVALYLHSVGKNFLAENRNMRNITLPSLALAGNNFMHNNSCLHDLNTPLLRIVGHNFMKSNTDLEELAFPLLTQVGNCFLCKNSNAKKIDAPLLKVIGDQFLPYNTEMEELELPSARNIGDDFMFSNKKIKKFCANELYSVGTSFLANNQNIYELSLPSLSSVDNNFMYYNTKLHKFNANKLKSVGSGFLYSNEELESLSMPSLEKALEDFMLMNSKLKKFDAPNLKLAMHNFMFSNEQMKYVSLPSLIQVFDNFMACNQNINALYLPNIKRIGYGFLEAHPNKANLINNAGNKPQKTR